MDQKFGPNREQCILTCNVGLSSVKTGKSFSLGCNARDQWADMNILLCHVLKNNLINAYIWKDFVSLL